MLYFEADSRDGSVKSSCNICCSENASVRPGETNLITINYRNWAAPLLGKGLAKQTLVAVSDNMNSDSELGVPTVSNNYIHTIQATPVNIDMLSDDAVKYEILSLYGLEHGSVTHTSPNDNTIIYVPAADYTGYDHIWYRVTNLNDKKNIGQIIVSVDESDGKKNPDISFIAPVTIHNSRIKVDCKNYLVSIPYSISPAARIDDIYRITIRQAALDCDCNQFWHEFYLDLTIGKC